MTFTIISIPTRKPLLSSEICLSILEKKGILSFMESQDIDNHPADFEVNQQFIVKNPNFRYIITRIK